MSEMSGTKMRWATGFLGWLLWIAFGWLLIPLGLYAAAKIAVPREERIDRELYG